MSVLDVRGRCAGAYRTITQGFHEQNNINTSVAAQQDPEFLGGRTRSAPERVGTQAPQDPEGQGDLLAGERSTSRVGQ